ncbi:MAG: hypothetical protein Q7R71_00235, partial [bacterium]|nr:hypothetical protein [bacterium]
MKFQPKAERGAVKIKFIKGSEGRFNGKELSIGYGDTKPLTRRKFVLLMRKVVATAKQNKAVNIAIDFKDIKSLAPRGMSEVEVAQI